MKKAIQIGYGKNFEEKMKYTDVAWDLDGARKKQFMYLISPVQKQYKANLHCHSIFSDGRKTPEELKEIYKRHGYDILAITDHEVPKAHNELTDPDFLMITGYENYIRTTEGGKYHPYKKEVHLNLFAREPENQTMICYNKEYCKYMSEEAQEALVKVGSERPREYTREYVNEFIRTAKENGYIVAYNHPYWSMEEDDDILAYEGYFSMEMCNYSSYLSNHMEYNGALYDKMLRMGKHVFCHSADDNHNKEPEGSPNWDSCGGFTMIMAEELTYDSVISAMEKGEMYSSMGPVFKEISLEEDKMHIECSEVAHIHVYFGGKTPCFVHANLGEVLTCADITIDGRAQYVRVSIIDQEGRAADTRGFFREELGWAPLVSKEKEAYYENFN